MFVKREGKSMLFSTDLRSFLFGESVCWGLHSHYAYTIGEGHQPNSRVYVLYPLGFPF